MRLKRAVTTFGFWLAIGVAILSRSDWSQRAKAVSPGPDAWSSRQLRIQTSLALVPLQDAVDPFAPYTPVAGAPVSAQAGGNSFCSITAEGGTVCSTTNYKNCSAQGAGFSCSAQPQGGGAGDRFCSAGGSSTEPNRCSADSGATCSSKGGSPPEGSNYECSAWGNAKCSAKAKSACSTSGSDSNQKCTSHQAASKCSVFSGEGGPPTQCTTNNGSGSGSGFCSAEGGAGQCSTENTPGGTWSGPNEDGICRASDP